jgi:hypothetical protein
LELSGHFLSFGSGGGNVWVTKFRIYRRLRPFPSPFWFRGKNIRASLEKMTHVDNSGIVTLCKLCMAFISRQFLFLLFI